MVRTQDTSYGEDYWSTLDGGAGYQDSVMWADLAHVTWEVFIADTANGVDRSGEHRCIDIGCAMGWFVHHMNRRGVETFGVDFSRYALDHAPEAVRNKLQWHDLRNGDPTHFGTGFTLVTCFETLEHIDESYVDNALGCIRDTLAPEGRALLTICTSDQPDWDTDPTHVTIYPRQWWEQRLWRAGFQLDEALVERIRTFWLFHRHDGVFVVRPR